MTRGASASTNTWTDPRSSALHRRRPEPPSYDGQRRGHCPHLFRFPFDGLTDATSTPPSSSNSTPSTTALSSPRSPRHNLAFCTPFSRLPGFETSTARNLCGERRAASPHTQKDPRVCQGSPKSNYCSSGAANAAIASTSGGYTDWFVPSEDEASALSDELFNDLGSDYDYCWTSSQSSGKEAYVQPISGQGYKEQNMAKTNNFAVCLARAF